jgi:hypothetical protein
MLLVGGATTEVHILLLIDPKSLVYGEIVAVFRTENITRPHFTPLVCSSAGHVRHYCIEHGQAPQQNAFAAPAPPRASLATSTTLPDDNLWKGKLDGACRSPL